MAHDMIDLTHTKGAQHCSIIPIKDVTVLSTAVREAQRQPPRIEVAAWRLSRCHVAVWLLADRFPSGIARINYCIVDLREGNCTANAIMQ